MPLFFSNRESTATTPLHSSPRRHRRRRKNSTWCVAFTPRRPFLRSSRFCLVVSPLESSSLEFTSRSPPTLQAYLPHEIIVTFSRNLRSQDRRESNSSCRRISRRLPPKIYLAIVVRL
ncbi:hypothetical protein TIFTF001_017161 [Ficus carica]|uniref:Uncharacterized protein n=1 Tax=Ficus carica TaxID=3494 RepID=A0AA88AU16_FICCA|nr:hypothetical protein TIFTF001_017161 [Ficus carica]